MTRAIDPEPVIQALEHHGWKRRWTLDHINHNGFMLTSPDGEDARLQIRGRNPNKDGSFEYWFGVYFQCLDELDYMIFWVRRKPKMLVIPTAFLKKHFNLSEAKIDDHDRWHVNITFQPFAELYPVGDQGHNVEEFALSLPDEVRRRS